LWVRTPFMTRCTRYNIMWSSLSGPTTGRWFSPSTPTSSTNKNDRHDITEILLKVALNTINQPYHLTIIYNYYTWTRSIWGFMEQSTTILNEAKFKCSNCFITYGSILLLILKFYENFEISETFWKFYHFEYRYFFKSYEIFESFEILWKFRKKKLKF
jgi:hypothetical protein